jgi:hypothetical protein
MPFELKKVNSRGWKVVDDKGREYSRKPLSKKRATAQLRALYASYNNGGFKEIKGGYIVKHEGKDHQILYGEGFFSDVFDKVKNVVKSAVSLVRRIPPIRRDYPPNVRAILSQYGNGTIVGLAVRREPIKSFINTALNWITKGKWDMAKREANYDNMFHLGLVVDVSVEGDVKRLLVEKNEVINITTSFSQSPDIQMLIVPPPTNPTITLNQMLENARNAMGDSFFLYDAFKNNCQNFVFNLLSNSGLMTPSASAFILQPIDTILKNLPSYTPVVARAITDIAGMANRVIYGEGMEGGICCPSCSLNRACRGANGGRSIATKGLLLKAVPVPANDSDSDSDDEGDLKTLCGGSIGSQLKMLKIPATQYLKSIRDAGQKAGYNPKDISLATDGEHKIMVKMPTGEVRYAGRVGYGDHHIYTFLESKGDVPKGTASEKQKGYLARATKIKGNWKKDKYSPNSLAISLLW